MSMSLQNFVSLADTIRRSNQAAADDPKVFSGKPVFDEYAIAVLATFCQEQNFRFNRERWISYVNGKCTVNGKAVK